MKQPSSFGFWKEYPDGVHMVIDETKRLPTFVNISRL